MKLIFNIDYRTNWGESVYVTGDIPALGAGDFKKALKLTLDGTSNWSLAVELPDDTPSFTYKYVVISEEGSVKEEWGKGNIFTPAADTKTYAIYDRWQDQPQNR